MPRMGGQGGGYRISGGGGGGRGDWRGGGGGAGGLADRVFENPQNPLGWSLRMFRFRGIDARIHLFTVIYFVTEVLWSIPRDHAGWIIMLGFMASLFVVVLLHEFGHCFACRWAGGESNRLVMLPFGGLAYTMPPHDWRSHLITTLGGPAVNVVLAVVSSVALFAMGRGEHVVFDPLSPLRSIPGQAGSSAGLIAVVLVWQFHVANVIILGFNLLLPFFPFDGGRVVQEVLWWRVGYRRSMEIATVVGLFGSGGLLVFAGMSGQMTLMMIALFGLWACWTERQRVRFADDPTMAATGLGVPSGGGVVRRGPSRAEVRARERAARDAAELDRILAKIADHGLPSLTRAEKRSLERLRKQKRRGPGVGGADWS